MSKKTKNTDKSKKIDFIGVGSAKSGSSWVGRCLEEHPDINLTKHKSVFFFNTDTGNDYIKDNWSFWHKGLGWYLDHFSPVEEGKIRGEFGVSYLHDPVAHERIHQLFPDAKILITLRDPVGMLYSLYWYNKNTVEAAVPETFEKAVKQGWCVDRGNYYKHMKKYFDLFPRENIFITFLDDIKINPSQVVKDLYTFLGVDPNFKPSVLEKKVYSSIGHRSEYLKKIGYFVLSTLNKLGLNSIRRFILDNPVFYSIYSKVNIVQKKYPPMDQDTEYKLRKYYKKDIHKLDKLLKRDLSAWK